MNRARVLVGVAVAMAFAAGIATGWRLALRQPQPGEPPAVGAPRAAIAGLPDRPPEFYGVIERLGNGQPDGRQAFFIRSVPPPAGVTESAQNVYERQFPPPHVNGVGVADSNARSRSGELSKLAVGQTVSVWCSGEVLTSYPAGWSADLVVIETPAE